MKTSSNGNIFRVTGFYAGNSPVTGHPQKGQCRRALMFSLICAWTKSWANNGDASDLRRPRAHYSTEIQCIYVYRKHGVFNMLQSNNQIRVEITYTTSGLQLEKMKEHQCLPSRHPLIRASLPLHRGYYSAWPRAQLWKSNTKAYQVHWHVAMTKWHNI